MAHVYTHITSQNVSRIKWSTIDGFFLWSLHGILCVKLDYPFVSGKKIKIIILSEKWKNSWRLLLLPVLSASVRVCGYFFKKRNRVIYIFSRPFLDWMVRMCVCVCRGVLGISFITFPSRILWRVWYFFLNKNIFFRLSKLFFPSRVYTIVTVTECAAQHMQMTLSSPYFITNRKEKKRFP
jgi:hypothetical protein